MILSLACLSAAAQDPVTHIMSRFSDPEKGSPVFIEKGTRAIGISGSFRSFKVGGDSVADGDGYSVLSFLNIGNGVLNTYSVAPRFSVFVANDLALGGRLEYSGYYLSSDLSLFNLPPILDWQLNHHNWSASFTFRKYLSFFGSKIIGVFAEARLYGKYGFTNTVPYHTNEINAETGKLVREDLAEGARYLATEERRHTDIFGVGLKVGGGLVVKFGDNAFDISVPLLGVGYNYSHQTNNKTGNKSHTSSFDLSRSIDILGVQVGYSHYIRSKKKK